MMNVLGTGQHGLHSVLFSPVILRRVRRCSEPYSCSRTGSSDALSLVPALEQAGLEQTLYTFVT